MKNIYKSMLSVVALLSVSLAVSATEAQKLAEPMKEMGGQHHGMGMGMMSGMTEEQKSEHMRSSQEHMLQMHDLSNQILAEKDAVKKEALKKQQLDLMKAHHGQMMERHSQKMLDQKGK
ncbi:MAG: hypothetical protein NTX38_18645 [Methylobacter sp.]|nr:hypothetical protein [Methylobacter sp.]